jgi:hypothetical protein
VCRADLDTRPVVREVRNGHLHPDGVSRQTFMKRVRMKPAQVVISCRAEGSHVVTHGLPEDLELWEVRVCAECIAGRQWYEVLAVWLDRRLEAP